MGRHERRMLRVPTVLAAIAIGAAPSCEGGGPSSSVSGENECYDILDEETCEAETAFECRWDTSSCVPNCPAYTDEDSCDGDHSCQWNGAACGLNQS